MNETLLNQNYPVYLLFVPLLIILLKSISISNMKFMWHIRLVEVSDFFLLMNSGLQGQTGPVVSLWDISLLFYFISIHYFLNIRVNLIHEPCLVRRGTKKSVFTFYFNGLPTESHSSHQLR